eukprot:scaffold75712_cov29-Tisochrysis_lutea.AAC.2
MQQRLRPSPKGFRNFDGRAGGARYGRATSRETAELPVFVSSRQRAAYARPSLPSLSLAPKHRVGTASSVSEGERPAATFDGTQRTLNSSNEHAESSEANPQTSDDPDGAQSDRHVLVATEEAPAGGAISTSGKVRTAKDVEKNGDSIPLLSRASDESATVADDEASRAVI